MADEQQSSQSSTLQKIGDLSAKLQSNFQIIAVGGGFKFDLTFVGDRASIEEMRIEYPVGTTTIPPQFRQPQSGFLFILIDNVMQAQEGGLASLRLSYRQLGTRETESDIENGLLQRSVGIQNVERQETIEHFAARIGSGSNKFCAKTFDLWLHESDPVAKATFKVHYVGENGEDTQVPISGDDGSPLDGSSLTQAIAERFLQGIQYASQYQVQITVSEQWKKAPELQKCGKILDRVPVEHCPECTVEGVGTGTGDAAAAYTWMRTACNITQEAAKLWTRQVIYLGVPKEFKPQDPPTDWGDKSIDNLLYGKDSDGNGGHNV